MSLNSNCSKLQWLLVKQKLTYQLDENYEVIVIASPIKDYRVSFFINQELHLELEKVNEIKVDLKSKGVVLSFGQYYYKDELSELEYFLVSNKSSNGAFLSSVKNFDFILVVKHHEDSVDVPYIIEKLKEVSEFQAAMQAAKLSNKDFKLLYKYI